MQKNSLYDVIILGAGPAGLQAAIHAARRKVSVLVFGKQAKSSLFHAHVENFCCLFNVAGLEAAVYAKKLKIESESSRVQLRQKWPDSLKSNG
ncbi:MAG: FAD-dependent oxidoreductase [Desulfobacterales bacterium]